MGNEHGEWIMRGVDERSPLCLHSAAELVSLVDELGFLPLFRNEIPGFSVEDRTPPERWWSDDEERDPWRWRETVAAGEKAAYGKFFGGRAGFVSLRWLPYLANVRRNGYDFDSLCDEGLAPRRSRLIMEAIGERELFSFELRREAGFGRGGERNFEGVLTELMMQTYLVIRDFRQRVSRAGKPYGWPIAVYARPEHIWGADAVTSAYAEEPASSRERIVRHILSAFPGAKAEDVQKIVR